MQTHSALIIFRPVTLGGLAHDREPEVLLLASAKVSSRRGWPESELDTFRPMPATSPSPPPPHQDESGLLFHIDGASPSSAGGGQDNQGFILDTQGDELFANESDLPPPPKLDFLVHSDNLDAQEKSDEPHGLVLPSNARVTKEGGPTDADEGDGSNTNGENGGNVLGEDRYYDDEDNDEDINENVAPVCSSCGEQGHLQRKCPYKRCLTCGALDEHYTRECPMGIVCHKCGLAGHRIRECTYRGPRRNQCTRCQSAFHNATACPTLWRIYAYLDDEEHDEEREMLYAQNPPTDIAEDDEEDDDRGGRGRLVPPRDWDPATRWCYNCAAKGNHWGDDCPEPRRLAMGDPTVWSESVTRTGPFAYALPPPPKLNMSVYQDDAAFGMGEPAPLRPPEQILNEYFARKRPRNGPPEKKAPPSLADRLDQRSTTSAKSKKERVPYSIRREREQDQQNASRWKRRNLHRPSSASANGMGQQLDYGAAEDQHRAGNQREGGLEMEEPEDDWFEARAQKQKQSQNQQQKQAQAPKKNRPTGGKKHQPPPNASSKPREPQRPPHFGKDDKFSFSFSQPASGLRTAPGGGHESGKGPAQNGVRDPPRIDLTRDTKPGAENERKKSKTPSKTAESRKRSRSKEVGPAVNQAPPRSSNTIPSKKQDKRKRSRAPQVQGQPPPSADKGKRGSAAPARHRPQYRGSLAD